MNNHLPITIGTNNNEANTKSSQPDHDKKDFFEVLFCFWEHFLCSFAYSIKPISTMENEIKRIYSGSLVDAEFIGSVLDENGIHFLIRNFQQESLLAGWAANVIKGEASVYVFSEDYDKAMLLLDDIQESEIKGDEA